MTSAATRAHRGEELELEIDSLAQGGRGVARADGYVVFVSGALPGDRVRARLTKARATTPRDGGRALAAQRGSDRRALRARGRALSGGPLAGHRLRQPTRHKRDQVDEALRRLGRLDGFELEPIEPAVSRMALPNKLEYSFGERPGELLLGFHRRGSWAEIVDLDDCLLASEANNAARNAVREWGHSHGLTAHDSRAQVGALRNLVVREGRRTGQIQTRLVTSPEEIRGLRSICTRSSRDHRRHRRPNRGARRRAPGRGARRAPAAALPQRVSPDEHRDGRAPLRDRGRAAGLGGRERVFDLYCGIGTIGLSLAGEAAEVWGLEAVPEAVADAEHNAAATESRTRASSAPTPASESPRCSRRRASRTWSSSIRRDPGSRRRSSAGCSNARRSGLSTSRATRRRSRQHGPDRRGGIYPAAREAGRHVPADAAHRVRRGPER